MLELAEGAWNVLIFEVASQEIEDYFMAGREVTEAIDKLVTVNLILNGQKNIHGYLFTLDIFILESFS